MNRLHVDLLKKQWTGGLVLLGTYLWERVLGFRLRISKGKCYI